MSGWSCPYFDEKTDWRRRLNTDCVPRRKGCILPKNLTYAVDPEIRPSRRMLSGWGSRREPTS